ncbi:uncharacterized protein LOC142588858 [Dermacentor variabilis]|uniref:uncharacterized protein LOC142588858 n=1 Tax=Dermacentor variabilis TaxID=34621 RepID=UPI003F5B1731
MGSLTGELDIRSRLRSLQRLVSSMTLPPCAGGDDEAEADPEQGSHQPHGEETASGVQLEPLGRLLREKRKSQDPVKKEEVQLEPLERILRQQGESRHRVVGPKKTRQCPRPDKRHHHLPRLHKHLVVGRNKTSQRPHTEQRHLYLSQLHKHLGPSSAFANFEESKCNTNAAGQTPSSGIKGSAPVVAPQQPTKPSGGGKLKPQCLVELPPNACKRGVKKWFYDANNGTCIRHNVGGCKVTGGFFICNICVQTCMAHGTKARDVCKRKKGM